MWFLRKATSFVFCHVVDTLQYKYCVFSLKYFFLSPKILLEPLGRVSRWSVENICAYFLSDLEIHQSLGLSSQNGSRFRMHGYCICLEGFMAFWWSWT